MHCYSWHSGASLQNYRSEKERFISHVSDLKGLLNKLLDSSGNWRVVQKGILVIRKQVDNLYKRKESVISGQS